MLIEADQYDNEELTTRLCIVGAGAAGITIARQLDALGTETVLLESGRFEPDPETQDLYRAEGSSGDFFPGEHITEVAQTHGLGEGDDYVKISRVRCFGGSVNFWGGYCRPLDALDFEPRDWVPNSGWPISKTDLEPYYHRACEGLMISPFGDDLANEPQLRQPVPLPESLETHLYHFSAASRFGELHRQAILESSSVKLVLGANCTELVLDDAGRRLRAVRVRTLGGRTFEVRAEVFVLAAGGIENPRLMLASDSVRSGGVGNEHDLVGRYFMEHPHVHVGEYLLWANPLDLTLYAPMFNPGLGHATAGVLCTTAEFQRQRQTLNFSAELNLVPETPARLMASFESRRHPVSQSLLRAAHELDLTLGEVERPIHDRAAVAHGAIFVRAEQIPDPENRVSLGTEKDALGLPRVRLDWRMRDLDFESIYDSALELGRQLSRAAFGRVRLAIDRQWRGHVEFGAHHMGTTRMSDDPRHGVVDADCRVHSVENLYVAGSSVFPTVGWANPTLTIVALAHRLADHLSTKILGD